MRSSEAQILTASVGQIPHVACVWNFRLPELMKHHHVQWVVEMLSQHHHIISCQAVYTVDGLIFQVCPVNPVLEKSKGEGMSQLIHGRQQNSSVVSIQVHAGDQMQL